MSCSAIVGIAGLVIIGIFAITEHRPRMQAKGESRFAQGAVPVPSVTDDAKSVAVTELPTAPEGE